MRFRIEFYEDEHGYSPVLRWLREELTPTQRRAIGVAMAEILQAEGIAVCRSGYGKQLGDGLFEFRFLLGGYDEGADPSRTRQQREITEARRRLTAFRVRTR